jgi:hypothetical protein
LLSVLMPKLGLLGLLPLCKLVKIGLKEGVCILVKVQRWQYESRRCSDGSVSQGGAAMAV